MNKINTEYIIEKIEDSNLFIEKIEKEPGIEIQKVNDYFQKRNKEKKIIKKRKYRLKISKLRECDVEIVTQPSIAIYKLENIEIKRKYNQKTKKKKTDYKKLKKSKREMYEYKGKEIKSNKIFIPKETRFNFKGKPKKIKKKVKNIIKSEITYFYKSPLIPKKEELSVGGNITNSIIPTNTIDKNESEHNIGKIISPDNSFQTKGEIEINISQNHIVGISPEKEDNNNQYNSNTYPINNINKNDSNQNDVIPVSHLKGDKKLFSRTYISPRRLRHSYQDKRNKNTTDFTANSINEETNENKQDINNNNANIKKEEKEEKKDKNEKNDTQSNNRVYYSTSFRHQKKEKNRVLDNNAIFISGRSSNSSSQSKQKVENKNDTKININKIVINSSNNSPIVLKNFENSRLKTDTNNLNKINIKSETNDNKNEKEEKEVKEGEITEKIEKEKKIEINISDNNKTKEPISMTTTKNNDEKNNFHFLDNFNNIDTPELSEYTRAYLNSYMSAARPELSDFSKQFLNSNVTNDSPAKPELSNITRAYLFSQNSSNDEK